MSEQQKKIVAEKAIEYLRSQKLAEGILGVGTGSTVNYFIDLLSSIKNSIEGAVASSIATEKKLKVAGIPLIDLNQVGKLSLYVDGADVIDAEHRLIKGGGGALTREKIIATMSDEFVCIVDESKKVSVLNQATFPLPVEVIPMARSFVARQLVKLGGSPEYRTGFITDNGNMILDVYGLNFTDPVALEKTLNQIEGVVASGLFAIRKADKVIVA
jgi:ribose 5-phosphate isomerase A